MIIDTHSHCYWNTLEPRIDDILANMKARGVLHAVQIGCDRETSEKAISLVQRFPHVFSATVGHHPETAQDIIYDSPEGESLEREFRAMIDTHRERIVAIGETWLDYHYLSPDPIIQAVQKKNQYDWLKAQWKLAQSYDLPLVIHTRDAREDTILYMRQYGIDRAVMHCFSEDFEFALELLEYSSEIYFSFSGILTYKSAPKIQEAASKIPLNRILIETDSPFLSPQVVRGSINEPANTRSVLEKLQSLRTEPPELIEQQVYENSLRFYGIKNLSN